MFLRCTQRKKDGKTHHYYSVVENRRVGNNKVTQRTVLYLGEINQLQEEAWQDLLDRFDSECHGHTVKPFGQQRLLEPWSLRPEAVDAIGVKLSQMELRRPRAFGNCWLGCEIWRLLDLDDFWREKLPEGQEGDQSPDGEGPPVSGWIDSSALPRPVTELSIGAAPATQNATRL